MSEPTILSDIIYLDKSNYNYKYQLTDSSFLVATLSGQVRQRYDYALLVETFYNVHNMTIDFKFSHEHLHLYSNYYKAK